MTIAVFDQVLFLFSKIKLAFIYDFLFLVV